MVQWHRRPIETAERLAEDLFAREDAKARGSRGGIADGLGAPDFLRPMPFNDLRPGMGIFRDVKGGRAQKPGAAEKRLRV